MKMIYILLFALLIVGCSSRRPPGTVTLYTFIYPPYTDSGPSGLFVDLIAEAYKSQGVTVNFEFDTLENSIKTARAQHGLMLASRSYEKEYIEDIGYYEFYTANTYIVSIVGRSGNGKIGTFSDDEVLYAQNHNLEPIQYTTPSDGLKLLHDGDVDAIICTDISCDQIKLTNPSVQFELFLGYPFPIDIVYFKADLSEDMKDRITMLKKGLEHILENGKYLKIQDSYKVANPLFQIPLEGLSHIKVKE